MRTHQEIEAEYKQIAMIYGDRLFQITMFQEEIKNLFQRMGSLKQEMAVAMAPNVMPVNTEVKKSNKKEKDQEPS